MYIILCDMYVAKNTNLTDIYVAKRGFVVINSSFHARTCFIKDNTPIRSLCISTMRDCASV